MTQLLLQDTRFRLFLRATFYKTMTLFTGT